MRISSRHFLWLSLFIGLSLVGVSGCGQSRNSAESGPLALQAAGAANSENTSIAARTAEFDKNGDYSGLVALARAQLKLDANDADARHALALGSFYNCDFPLAVAEWEAITQTPAYAQNAEVLELLRVARFLKGRYPDQKFEPVQAVTGEIAAQSEKWRARGATLITAKKYDEIEKIAADQTRKPTIMSDGGWVLAPFYVGLWDGDVDAESEVQWKINHARVVAWNAARPASQLARNCLARSWTNGAWLARGSEYADKVSPQAWKTVEERQLKAAPIYGKLLKEKATSPLVYAAAQRFGRLGNAPRDWHDQVLKNAVAKFPDYTDFYRERAIYLLPRWDGAPGEWERELETSADEEAARLDAAAGDRLYARVVWEMWEYHRNLKEQTQIDWPRTKRGFDSILQQNPGSLSATTMYLRLCYQWNEGIKAREILQITGGRADSSNWDTPNRFARQRIMILRLLP